MSGYTTTPLDVIDIPAGVQFQIGTRRFFGPATWRWHCFDDLIACRTALLWSMNSGNVAKIRVNLYRGESRWPAASLEVTRPNALGPWTCPQVPEWRQDASDPVAAAAVNAAVEIIAQHQRAH